MHVSINPPLPQFLERAQLRSSLDLAFSFGRSIPGREVCFVLLALAVHGALSFVVGKAPAHVAVPERVTEVELPPPAPPEPARAEPPPEAKEEPVRIAKPSSIPPPQAARAGALVTAKESAPAAKKDELVDFVTDPNGTSYGSGVAARGGTADHGAQGATIAGTSSTPAPVKVAAPLGEKLVAAADLSRRATLQEQNACAGFYPREADADSGAVTLTVIVGADGHVSSASVLSESPIGQGFAKAARACLQKKRFDPSLDRAGNAVNAATTVKLRFVR